MTKIYKFTSKISNYSVVLRPGLEGNKAFGIQPTPQISVRFRNGEAEISKAVAGFQPDELYEMMKAHSSFGSAFVDATDGADPFANIQRPTEPIHEMTEMKFGTPVNTIGAKIKNEVTPEQKKALKSALTNMLTEMSVDELQALITKKSSGTKKVDSVKEKTNIETEIKTPKIKEPEVEEPKVEKTETNIGATSNSSLDDILKRAQKAR